MDFGLGIIYWLQTFSPALDAFFRAVTFLGDEAFFMLFLPFLYWCVDRRTGMRLTILFLLSSYLNSVAKTVADQPRPFEVHPRVKRLVGAGGGGLPSGHTQGAVVVWGYLGSQLKTPWAWVIAGLLVVFVPLSRLYLGVHFPVDLLGGYLLGAAVLGLFLALDPWVSRWFSRNGLGRQMAVAVLVPVLVVILSGGGNRFALSSGAALAGMGLGFVLERRWVGFEAGGPWWQRVLRFVLGAVILVGLSLGLKAAFAGAAPEALYRFFRYGLVGLWGAFGAPWLFKRLGLVPLEMSGDRRTG
jgi:membrane-associated phospholipid phosphatase